MIHSVLALAQFAFPVTNAYAVQVKDSVVVSVTYESELPVETCASMYALDDLDMVHPIEVKCWKPTSIVGEFYTWENNRIDFNNYTIEVRYPGNRVVKILLLSKLNT